MRGFVIVASAVASGVRTIHRDIKGDRRCRLRVSPDHGHSGGICRAVWLQSPRGARHCADARLFRLDSPPVRVIDRRAEGLNNLTKVNAWARAPIYQRPTGRSPDWRGSGRQSATHESRRCRCSERSARRGLRQGNKPCPAHCPHSEDKTNAAVRPR